MAARILDFRSSERSSSEAADDSTNADSAADASPCPSPKQLVIDADADGRRVRVSASDEIVFECGEASITLKSDGRVIVRGTYVETHSTGTNRIKGGTVRIN